MHVLCARARQIFRPTPIWDHGIDGEIEFRDASGEASGRRVYVQLKSGDSYLRPRKRDQKLIFDVREERHIRYWQAQRYDVFLVIMDSSESLKWMNVSKYLRNRADPSSLQIVFDGELLDKAAIVSLRDRTLAESGSETHFATAARSAVRRR